MGDEALSVSGAAKRLAAYVLGLALALALTAPASADPTLVRVADGKLRGMVTDGVIAFKGIPFAAPPVDGLRWRPPQPAASWTGVRQAADFGPDCMQNRWMGPPPGTPAAVRGGAPAPGPASAGPAPAAARAPSEDCLYLNLWRPADPAARNLPVMVWIYGGGFTGGSSATPQYSGQQFAKQGVILVNFNYRVGRFGFFAFPGLSAERPNETKGNYGYMDQIAALRWIKANIAAFGGDPGNVTIFGQSAGGVSVHSLLVSPLARGLFQKAIVESGGSRDSVLTARPLRGDGVNPNYPLSAETIGVNFAHSMGIEGADQAALSRLRALSADQVLSGAPEPGAPATPPVETTPILDGKLVTETAETAYKAGRAPVVPLMLGSTSGDTAGNRIRATAKDQLFARYGANAAQARAAYDPTGTADFATVLANANGDFGQAEPARFAANAFAAKGAPVYLYRFSYLSNTLPEAFRAHGVPHTGEISYAFGTLTGWGGAPVPTADWAVSRMTQNYWVNFAKTGDPNGPGLPNWPRHQAGTDQVFEFRADGSAGSEADPWKPRLDVTQAAIEAGKRADP